MKIAILILAGAAAALAQYDRSDAIFPVDAQDLKLVDTGLLNAACPKREVVGGKMICRSGCPNGAAQVWTVGPVIPGHFLSAASDDAVVGMDGCAPHAGNFGGTILLTRGVPRWRPGWTVVSYKGGLRIDQCHKVSLPDGLDVLVCLEASRGSWGSATDLVIPDLAGDTHGQSLIGDQFNDCGMFSKPNALGRVHAIQSHIDKVEFLPVKDSTAPMISVAARFADAWVDRGDPSDCALPPPNSYRIDFTFDGKAYKATPATAEALHIFEGKGAP